jgi:hypothetical protein
MGIDLIPGISLDHTGRRRSYLDSTLVEYIRCNNSAHAMLLQFCSLACPSSHGSPGTSQHVPIIIYLPTYLTSTIWPPFRLQLRWVWGCNPTDPMDRIVIGSGFWWHFFASCRGGRLASFGNCDGARRRCVWSGRRICSGSAFSALPTREWPTLPAALVHSLDEPFSTCCTVWVLP